MDIPPKAGFQTRTNEHDPPRIPIASNVFHVDIPYFFISKACPMALKDRNINKKPTYKGRLTFDIAGFDNKRTPTRVVIIPSTKVHPQLSICFLFIIENMISIIPVERNEILNKTDRPEYDSAGCFKVHKPSKIKMIPEITGRYQCLTASLIGLKNPFFIVLFFKNDKNMDAVTSIF